MFYYATGITPAMIMRLPDIGSQYLMAFQDADKQDFDGGKTYKVTRFRPTSPRLSSGPSRYTTTRRAPCYRRHKATHGQAVSPTRLPLLRQMQMDRPPSTSAPRSPLAYNPATGCKTVSGKGWNTILRLYSPLEPFFLLLNRLGNRCRVSFKGRIASRGRCCRNASMIGSTRAILFARSMCSWMRWNCATSGSMALIRQRPAGRRTIR